MTATLGAALAAGMLAAVNPCGFALLPAYVTLLVTGEKDGDGRAPVVGRALLLTGAMTVGFVAVFGGFGLLAASAADALARQLPWLTVVIGLVLVLLGGWLLAGRGLPALPQGLVRGPAVTRRFGSMTLFGMGYAVASLGCTIAPFLLVVVIAGFGQGSLLVGAAHLLVYAAGMGLVVGTVAVAVALARVSFVRGLRRATPWLSKGGGLLLVVAGGYVAWYGWYELRLFAGGSADDPVVDAAGRVQQAVASWLTAVGPTRLALAAAILLTLAALATSRRSRTYLRGLVSGRSRRRPTGSAPAHQDQNRR